MGDAFLSFELRGALLFNSKLDGWLWIINVTLIDRLEQDPNKQWLTSGKIETHLSKIVRGYTF